MYSQLKGDLESGALTEIDQVFTTSINDVDVLDKITTGRRRRQKHSKHIGIHTIHFVTQLTSISTAALVYYSFIAFSITISDIVISARGNFTDQDIARKKVDPTE